MIQSFGANACDNGATGVRSAGALASAGRFFPSVTR